MDLPKKDQRDYAKVKARVLEVGRFSSFENASIFDQLVKDRELVITNLGFPWTGVKRRT